MSDPGPDYTPDCWQTTFGHVELVRSNYVALSSDLNNVEVEWVVHAMFSQHDFSVENNVYIRSVGQCDI